MRDVCDYLDGDEQGCRRMQGRVNQSRSNERMCWKEDPMDRTRSDIHLVDANELECFAGRSCAPPGIVWWWSETGSPECSMVCVLPRRWLGGHTLSAKCVNCFELLQSPMTLVSWRSNWSWSELELTLTKGTLPFSEPFGHSTPAPTKTNNNIHWREPSQYEYVP